MREKWFEIVFKATRTSIQPPQSTGLSFNKPFCVRGDLPFMSALHRTLCRAGRKPATPDRSGRYGSSFGLRHSPGGSIPASMARAV